MGRMASNWIKLFAALFPLAMLSAVMVRPRHSAADEPATSSVCPDPPAPDVAQATGAGRTGAPLMAPANSVQVGPGGIQAAVNANDPNTSFLLLPGTYTDDPVVPKNGDGFYGQGQAIWDGGGYKSQAFNAAGSSNVIVSGITFNHFAPPNQGNGIFNLNTGDSNVLIEGSEIADNSGTPVSVGNGTHVTNTSIHDNNWVGIGGYNVSSVIIDHNEIYRNYLAQLSPDTATGDASGIKFTLTTNASIKSNYIHDNYGVGVWFDGDNTGTVIDNNLIAGNTYRGIMDEISYGATIVNNVITANGALSDWIAGAGILISTAKNVEACNNVVTENSQGIVAFQQARGSGPQGQYVTTQTKIHDNFITMGEGVSGFALGTENDPTNLFYNNHYCLKNQAGFIWGVQTSVPGWQAAGQDKGATFTDCKITQAPQRRE
jgi:hypothetical protein